MTYFQEVVSTHLYGVCPHITEVRYQHILGVVEDMHFFQVKGVPLFENVPVMKKVAEVYYVMGKMFPEKCIAILDGTSLTDMSGAVVLPKIS